MKARSTARAQRQAQQPKLTVDGGKINLDFTVFSAKKYSGSIKGHFEGNAAQL